MNNYLRIEVKKLKIYQSISYKEIASYLEIPYTSFICWLKGYYNFGVSKQTRLNIIIDNLKE